MARCFLGSLAFIARTRHNFSTNFVVQDRVETLRSQRPQATRSFHWAQGSSQRQPLSWRNDSDSDGKTRKTKSSMSTFLCYGFPRSGKKEWICCSHACTQQLQPDLKERVIQPQVCIKQNGKLWANNMWSEVREIQRERAEQTGQREQANNT